MSEDYEQCNCEICQKWRDKSDRVTEIIVMPRGLRDTVLRFYNLANESDLKLSDQPFELYLSYLVTRGLVSVYEEQKTLAALVNTAERLLNKINAIDDSEPQE
jgi:hypothetical protein